MHTERFKGLKAIWIAFLSLVFAANAQAQEINIYRLDSIPVYVNGVQLDYPFTGGMSMPRFNNFDLNNDGIWDLTLFEPFGDKFLPFILEEKNGVYQHQYKPEYESMFPDVERYLMVIDFNGDGIKDIVSSQELELGVRTLRFFKGKNGNNSGTAASYEEISHRPLLADQAELLEMHRWDIPTVGDINGDGDVDILLFPQTYTKIHYFENQSIEMGYGQDSLIFDLYDDCWGRVRYSLDDGLELEACPRFREELQIESRNSCAGSYLMNQDIDQDGDQDIIFSNLSLRKLFLVQNNGNSEEADLLAIDPEFMTNIAGELPYFPGAYRVHTDEDTIKDFVVTTNSFGSSLIGESDKQIFQFNNAGSNLNPDYEIENREFLKNHTIDEGFRSSPATIDYNGDGLVDIVVAANRHDPDQKFFSQFSLYQNNGTLDKPSFVKVQDNFANISNYSIQTAHPTFGDLDNDGDEDLVIGENLGRLYYFENKSIGSQAYDFELQVNFFDGIDVGNNANPQIIDLDRDGLKDIVIGSQFGKISLLKNTGTLESPQFELTSDSIGGLFPIPAVIESDPFFFEANDSSGYLLLNGLATGNIELYQNIENNLQGTFEKTTGNLAGINLGGLGAIHLADLNGDGSRELICGNERGGINIYHFEVNPIMTTSTTSVLTKSFKIYPNPVTDQLNIEIPMAKENTILSLYDAAGVLINQYTIPANTERFELNVKGFSDGLYFCSIQQGLITTNEKIIISR